MDARNRVVRILMHRDGLTEKEAVEMVENTASEIYDAIEGTSCVEPEEIMMNEVGLEPDYIFDIL